MRALEPEVFDAVWGAVRALLPAASRFHPLGCHRPRICDEVCFRGLMIRLVTGASWVDVEAIMDFEVSDTTLRARRDEWIAAGVFDELCKEALAAFDRIVGLDLEEVALDGSLHKAPCGGEGTGPNPTDRAKIGWKWSVASERHGVPIGWAISGDRNDIRLLEPTLGAVAAAGLLEDIGTLHLDRGYDYPVVRSRLAALGIATSTPTPRHQTARNQQAHHARASLDRRIHQLLAVQLRTTAPQHRPPKRPPPRRSMPRHHRAHRRQTTHLPRPLGK